MATPVSSREAPTTGQVPTSSQAPRPPRVPRRRRPWLIVIAIVLASVAAYGNYVALTAQDARVPILVLAQPVAWGQRITEADLTVAQTVPDSSAHTIPASRRGSVVGQSATTALPAGSVLAPEDLAVQAIPGPGQQLVGLRTKPGQLPARALNPGDLVQVVPVASNSTISGTSPLPATGATGAPFQARVADIGPPDANGAVTVDVVVGTDTLPAATTAASGTVVIVLLGPGS